MPPSSRTLAPTLLSLALPLLLRTGRLTLEPRSLYICIGLLALLSERGYRETLETLSPEFSEHTGPFSHIGICLLAHMFAQSFHGWRSEVLYWTIFGRWAFGLCRTHRDGLDSFKEAYKMRFKGVVTRAHAVLAATLLAPIFVTANEKWLQGVAVWLHFYHCVGYMVAVWTYFGLPKWQNLMEQLKIREGPDMS